MKLCGMFPDCQELFKKIRRPHRIIDWGKRRLAMSGVSLTAVGPQFRAGGDCQLLNLRRPSTRKKEKPTPSPLFCVPLWATSSKTMDAIPATQTAIIQDTNGQATLTHGSPVPALREGCVLVETVAVALNPSDHKMGAAFPSAGAIVGADFAGRIVAIHASVATDSRLSIGDAVCGISHGSNPGDHESGAFGQFVLAQAELLLRVPEDWLPLHEAAALGTALFTACAALWGSLRLAATPERPLSLLGDGNAQPVLVYGGSTACGSMAVQLLSL